MKDMLETGPLSGMPVERLEKINTELISAFSNIEQSAMDISAMLFKA